MSSLAASRADNFYFPPEWRPEMGGISKFQGSKGANQWEQRGVIRFELPFDGWCLKCERHMGKGLRFNAKKENEGKYFSTQIYSFSMKCYTCDQQFKILTDPKNCTYDYAEGIRKHEQDYQVEVGDSVIEIASDQTKQLLESDVMFRLQHREEDHRRSLTNKERLEGLMNIQEENHKDDYDMNSMLRAKHRKRKKRDIELAEDGKRRGLSMAMVEPSSADDAQAKEALFRKRPQSHFQTAERLSLANVRHQSIFAGVERGAESLSTCTTRINNSSSSAGTSNSSRGDSHRITKPSTGSGLGSSSSSSSSSRKPGQKLRRASRDAQPSSSTIQQHQQQQGQYERNKRLLAKASALEIDTSKFKLSSHRNNTNSSRSRLDITSTAAISKIVPLAINSRGTCKQQDNKIHSSKGAAKSTSVAMNPSARNPCSSSVLDMLANYDDDDDND